VTRKREIKRAAHANRKLSPYVDGLKNTIKRDRDGDLMIYQFDYIRLITITIAAHRATENVSNDTLPQSNAAWWMCNSEAFFYSVLLPDRNKLHAGKQKIYLPSGPIFTKRHLKTPTFFIIILNHWL